MRPIWTHCYLEITKKDTESLRQHSGSTVCECSKPREHYTANKITEVAYTKSIIKTTMSVYEKMRKMNAGM